jgi:type IV pilus assembly protein PilN
MIRINLLGLKAKPKPTASRKQLVVFAALLIVEAAFLFLWHQKLSADLAEATKRTKEASAKIDDLKRVKQSWETWQAEKADLDRQSQVFETLRADQIGPPMMLQYLSYSLTALDDSPAGRDEARAQELAGWNPKWDARRVWLNTIRQTDRGVTFDGQALDHEDVAEFYRRIESTDFFSGVEPGLQTRKVHPDLGIRYVDFTAKAIVSYRAAIEPDQKPADAAPATPPPAPSGPGGPGGPGAPVSGKPGAMIDAPASRPLAAASPDARTSAR